MKKKLSIVISVFFLFALVTSCEPDEQINSFKSDGTQISVDKNAQTPLEPTALTKDEIADNSCEEPVEQILYAGQHIEVGTVSVSNDEEFLYVTYDLTGTGWWLKETHLFAGDLENVPFGNSGNPKIGHFPYHGDHDMTQEYHFEIPLEKVSSQDCFAIIAHAVVVSKENGNITSSETAFAFGADQFGEPNEFDGNRWGWFVDYCLQDCEDQEGGDDGQGDEEGDLSLGENEGGEDDNNGNTEENELTCVDSYAFYGDNASCFASEGNGWGWSNWIQFNEDYYDQPGVTYQFPLYETKEGCDTGTDTPIGHVEVTVQAGDAVAYANVRYVIDIEEWSIEDIKLYIGSESLLTGSGNEVLNFENFNYSIEDFENNYLERVVWPFDAYMVAYAKICPPESNP